LRTGRAGSVSCTAQTNRFVTQTVNNVELTELKFAESLKRYKRNHCWIFTKTYKIISISKL